NWQVGTLAGTGTAGSTNGAGNVATLSGLLTEPTCDALGNVFLPETTGRIRRITLPDSLAQVGYPAGSPPTEKVQLANADGFVPNGAGNQPYKTTYYFGDQD